jgi:Family of unknown function (DUF6065)
MLFIKAWQLHPKSCRIEKAEKTCMGLANKGGTQWCGPYTNANRAGFWLYSPIDIDFTWDGESFQIHHMEEYGGEDYSLVKNLVRPSDNSNFEKWCFPGAGRTKTTIGLVEKNVIQLWTGIIFETPPGWCLHIRSPVNFPKSGIEIMEAVLETDWMHYDIWMNVVCTEKNKKISIRKDTPIAQIIPVRRETFKAEWELENRPLGRETEGEEKVFKYWLDYNRQKFETGGNQPLTDKLTKDSTTYFRERNKMVGRGMEPVRCPFGHVEKKAEEKKEPSRCPFMHKNAEKTMEEEMEEFRTPKPNGAEYFPLFERDVSEALYKIGKGSQKH